MLSIREIVTRLLESKLLEDYTDRMFIDGKPYNMKFDNQDNKQLSVTVYGIKTENYKDTQKAILDRVGSEYSNLQFTGNAYPSNNGGITFIFTHEGIDQKKSLNNNNKISTGYYPDDKDIHYDNKSNHIPNGKYEVSCRVCNKEFRSNSPAARYCSSGCKDKYHKGKMKVKKAVAKYRK